MPSRSSAKRRNSCAGPAVRSRTSVRSRRVVTGRGMTARWEAFRAAVQDEWAHKSVRERREFLASINLGQVCAAVKRGASIGERAFAVFVYEGMECSEDKESFSRACGAPEWLTGASG